MGRGGLTKYHYLGSVNWGLELHTLLRNLLRVRSRWILCHQDDPHIRDLYSGFKIVEYSHCNTFSSSTYTAAQADVREAGGRNRRTELLVLSSWVSDQLDFERRGHSSLMTVPVRPSRDGACIPAAKRRRLSGKQ